MPPPRKKRKTTHGNPISDTDSGGSSDVQSGRTRKIPAGSTTAGKQKEGMEHTDKQISGFVSEQELAKYARTLGLKRIMLADLKQQSDLNGSYVGGQVMSHCSSSYSQGHELSIFIQDESTTRASQFKHLRINICREVAEKIPTLRDDAKIFLHKAVVVEDSCDFSQDLGKCLLVKEDDTQVWIVHKDAHDPLFLSHTSCGKKWWKKTKQMRDKIKSKWSAENVGESSKRTEDKVVLVGESSKRTEDEVLANGEDGPSLQQPQSFPDNSDFPDSAFFLGDMDGSITPSASNYSEETSSTSDSGESDTEWLAKGHKTDQPGRLYQYTLLEDLQEGDKKVNVFGVVKEFKPPVPSCGSDYYSTMTLVDETNPRVGVKCIIFNKSPDKHPHLKRDGDVICLHRVNIKSHNYQIQIQGTSYSSTIRFSGDKNKKVKPHTGSISYTFTVVERKRVRELREWSWRQRKEDHLKKLQNVGLNDYFDLVCQVVSVTISKVPRCTVLTVWDGTLLNLNCRNPTLEKKYEEGYPIVKDDEQLAESSEGYRASIIIYDKICISKALKLLPGQFVYLKNLHASVVDRITDLVEICIHGVHQDGIPFYTAGKIELLSKHKELYDDIKSEIEKTNMPVAITRHQNQPLCTIAEIISYAGPLPTKFHCRAKVLSITSSSLEDMVLVHCSQCDKLESVSHDREMDGNGVSKEPCSICFGLDQHTTSHPSCIYYFKMVLRDRSGEMEVEVGNAQALQLFNRMRPNNFYQYQTVRYQLLEKVYILTGGNVPFISGGTGGVPAAQQKPRPWIDCCILAANHDGTIYHCLFDTRLKQK